MKSAFPVSAQIQNGSSPGSGEMLLPALSGVSSAWERIRLIAAEAESAGSLPLLLISNLVVALDTIR